MATRMLMETAPEKVEEGEGAKRNFTPGKVPGAALRNQDRSRIVRSSPRCNGARLGSKLKIIDLWRQHETIARRSRVRRGRPGFVRAPVCRRRGGSPALVDLGRRSEIRS